MIHKKITFILILLSTLVHAQSFTSESEKELSFEEYLGYVKQYHPIVKQANLKLTEGEATLLKARGGFDPKIEVDYDRKKFKGTEYYDQLNAAFKIPTWYGIEFKANFEENTGDFLNPSLTVPEDGIYSAGVSLSLAQGLLINDRMAMLKKARFFQQQTIAERDILINDLIFEASTAYFEWLEATTEQKIFTDFLKNATERFNGIKRGIEAGDKAAIDSVEAKITLQDRQLALEAASLKRTKAALKVSNFLWLNNVPIQVEDHLLPIAPDNTILKASLLLNQIIPDRFSFIDNHPKIRSLDAKIEGLSVDRSLKKNKLLPKLDVQYNFLSTEYNELEAFNSANYKAALTFRMPLFLRKERGDLRLAKLKIMDTNFERANTTLTIQNKIEAVKREIESLENQNNLIGFIIKDYITLVSAEERKFSLGESSLFLINSREKGLIDAQLKGNNLKVKWLTSYAKLFNVIGVTNIVN